MKPILLALAAIAAPAPDAPPPGSEEAAVLATVDAMFEAMARRDQAAFFELMVAEATSIGVRVNQPPEKAVRIRRNAEAFATIGAGKEVLLERIWDPTVRVHGPIAMVWAPYDFHIDGKFSHCGVDLFEFLKADGKWRLSNASWTVQTENCAPSPLGPPPPPGEKG